MTRDFYIEFYSVIDKILQEAWNLPTSARTLLFEASYTLRSNYNQRRIAGEPAGCLYNEIRNILLSGGIGIYSLGAIDFQKFHAMDDALSSYRHSLIIYIYNNRQISYLRHIITELNRPIVLLCEHSVNLDIEMPEFVSAIEIDLSLVDTFKTTTVPKLTNHYRYYVFFNLIFQAISPDGIIVLEGCHFQEQILGELSKSFGVPCIGIQQGWPSFMHSMFRRWPYSHYLTWGSQFNHLWGKASPKMKCVATGYPLQVAKTKTGGAITFFLQGPLFISDETYCLLFCRLIKETAMRYPDMEIMFRQHPECRLPAPIIKQLQQIPNIIDVTERPLLHVYSRTAVVIAHFSSTIMECVIHGCIPIVFDPTTDSIYNPNIETLGIGAFSKTATDLLTKINTIIAKLEEYKAAIAKVAPEWFSAVEADALCRITSAINRIAPISTAFGETKLNLGCGRNLLSGWLNTDLYPITKDILQLDAGRHLPFPDCQFEYIFSEHLFEHLDIRQQRTMLRECLRIMKPGGVLRLAMPNFNFLLSLYNDPGTPANSQYLDWSYHTFVYPYNNFEATPHDYPVYVINNFMHNWGHQFIHSPQSIIRMCHDIGFTSISECNIGESSHPVLSNLERHHNEIPAWANALETFVIELSKPK